MLKKSVSFDENKNEIMYIEKRKKSEDYLDMIYQNHLDLYVGDDKEIHINRMRYY